MILHVLLTAIGIVALMIWGLAVLARHRGGVFRIQYGSNFHKGYQHR